MARVWRFLMKSIFPVFLLLLAMAVGWYLYPYAEPRWAEITEFRAAWDQQTGTIELGLVIDKHANCKRTPVLKYLQELNGDDIKPMRISVSGNLPDKIQRLPLGTHWVPDRATPNENLSPGQYILTLQVTCEQDAESPKIPLPPPLRGETTPLSDPLSVPPSNPLFETLPVQTIIIVPTIPVRAISKAERQYQRRESFEGLP